MSCCAEKIGPARLAEHPGIILFAYICALLPLAAIYALDFITESWKSIRKTRRGGLLHLAVSLPPLAVVVFYIHLQRLAMDYKEMATAITAAILCIVHILRTLWGLAQLQAFKEWNIHALHVLTRMGFDTPVYVPAREAEQLPRPGYRDPDSESDSVSSICARSCHIFSRISSSIQEALGLQQMDMFTLRQLYQYNLRHGDQFGLTADEIERTVDNHMMVNSSLVDNEFSGAYLPCRPNFSVLKSGLSRGGLSITDFLTSRKPEDCAIQWIASFLSRFGSEWLIHTNMLQIFGETSGFSSGNLLTDTTGSQNSNLPQRLVAFLSFVVMQTVQVESRDGPISSQQVSILSPVHVMCSDLHETWTPTLQVTAKNALPYRMRGCSNSKQMKFAEHASSIRNVVSTWHKHSFNELDEERKQAVLNMSPHQVACFSKLIEERNSHLLPIYKGNVPYAHRRIDKQRFNTFLWQLGFDAEPLEDHNIRVKEVSSPLFDALPVLQESLRTCLDCDSPMSDNCPVLQASVQVDNWMALEAGQMPLTYEEALREVSEAEVRNYGHIFSAQKRIEIRRLQFEVTSSAGPDVSALRKIKFLGCIMESVRTSMANWLQRSSRRTDWDNSQDILACWNTPLSHDSFTFPCSDQLSDALLETSSEKSGDSEFEESGTCRKALHMRLLWEIQRSLIRADSNPPDSVHVMMLCMLGYPSIRISKVRDCLPMQPSGTRRDSTLTDGTKKDVIVSVGDCDETQEKTTVREKIARKHSQQMSIQYRIDIVEAPQPLNIIFQWSSASRHGNVQIASNGGRVVTRFCWQSWKDGFMGRIWAQSEWRSKRLQLKNEMVRKEALTSKLSESISNASQSETDLTYWKGWPPFLSNIALFEMRESSEFRSPSDLDEALNGIPGFQGEGDSSSSGIEAEIDATRADTECACGCEGHERFLFAKELWDKGLKKEAVEIFGHCIKEHRHSLALQKCVQDVFDEFDDKGEILDRLLYFMSEGMERMCEEHTEPHCRKYKHYHLEHLIEFFGNLYDKSKDVRALHCKGRALLLGCQPDDVCEEKCIEAFESYLVLRDSNMLHRATSHFCLGLCFRRRFCATAHSSDKELGMRHFGKVAELQPVEMNELTEDLALLFQKDVFF